MRTEPAPIKGVAAYDGVCAVVMFVCENVWLCVPYISFIVCLLTSKQSMTHVKAMGKVQVQSRRGLACDTSYN
jgi:hypothetical protein